jgi:hypothetical protein
MGLRGTGLNFSPMKWITVVDSIILLTDWWKPMMSGGTHPKSKLTPRII